MEMSPERWAYVTQYARDVFGRQDDHLAGLREASIAEGLPDIAVDPEVGRLLMILAATTRGRLGIEVGTLGGYSGIWIARGLAPDGRLITIEAESKHAEFAQRQFARAGLADRVEVRLGAGLDVLPELATELGPGSVDVVFLDAIKVEYPDYWVHVRPLIAAGGLILADNVYGSNWWIGDEHDPTRDAVDRFNRAVADDPEFEAVAVPIRNGVMIGRRR